MRLALSLLVLLAVIPLSSQQADQMEIRNSSLIGIAILHRPTRHCSNGTTRTFLVDVSKQSPELVPVLPELTDPLAYPLILDAGKQILFSNSENHDPTILPHSTLDFTGWIDQRRGFRVLRGEFSTDPAQQAFSSNNCDAINTTISYDIYEVNPSTNRKISPTVVFRSRGKGSRYDNQSIQPLKAQDGTQVGWIFRSVPPGEMWATDIDGWNAVRIAAIGNQSHGCALSPRDPILACEGLGADSKSAVVLGVKVTILGGSYWAAIWAPDGSGFLNRDDSTKPGVNYYAIDRTKPIPTVTKGVPVMPKDWTPIICCNGEGGWPFGSALYSWSPDSRWIYYSATSAGTGNVILRVSRRDPNVFDKLTDKIVRDAAYPEPSPDGNYLAFLSTGTDPKPEPGACPAGDKTEWNVQLYTVCLTCLDPKRKLHQITHLGCNTMPTTVDWSH